MSPTSDISCISLITYLCAAKTYLYIAMTYLCGITAGLVHSFVRIELSKYLIHQGLFVD